MRIVVEARSRDSSGGVGRYVAALCENVPQVAPQHAFTFLSSKPAHPLLLSWWLNVTLAREAAVLKPDIVHFTKADIPNRKIASTVVTVYDVIPLLYPDSQQLVQRFYWPRAFARVGKGADRIITISEASRRDICRLLSVPPEHVRVIPLAVDSTLFARPAPREIDVVRQRWQLDKPYILFVGTLEPKKNVPTLIDAFAKIASQIPHSLVIAGAPAHDYGRVRERIRKHHLADRVKLLAFVPQPDLPGLYAGSDLFVYPSIYEGWGFPVQEALMSGVPVIVSDGGSLPEVVGTPDSVVRFTDSNIMTRAQDSEFCERLSQKIVEVLQNDSLRATIVATGRQHVQQRSWLDVAKETVAVYEELK